jgi:hypothetical protein
MSVKVDFKRELSELYKPGRDPALVEVPELSFMMIDGQGDPNTSDAYRDALEALFSVSYTLKFTLKRAEGGLDYAVMPLEGLWWSNDGSSVGVTDKSTWSWTSMIMQPDEVTAEMVSDAIEAARAKRPIPAADGMRLERFDEGLSAQLLHFGSYAEEGPNIVRLHEFIASSGYVLVGKHHEIYLGDPRRSAPEKLRTVIRQPVGRA